MTLSAFEPEKETIDEFVARARKYAEKMVSTLERKNDPERKILNMLRGMGLVGGEWGEGDDSDKYGWDRDVIAKKTKLRRGETTEVLKRLVDNGKVECFYGKDWYLYRKVYKGNKKHECVGE